MNNFFRSRSPLKKSWFRWLFFLMGLGLAIAIAIGSTPEKAVASKRMVITYGPIQISVTSEDLRNFAETGEVPVGSGLVDIVRVADADDIRAALMEEVEVNPTFLDNALNHIGGKFLLAQVGQVIYPKNRELYVKAIRSAVVLAAADDNRISLLETIEKYPTPEVYVNAVRLRDAYTVIAFVGEGAEKALSWARNNLSDLICASASPRISAAESPSLDRT